MRLSAVVITHNEECNIARCLESLRFCDEVVVVDAESSDRTLEIARGLATRVVSRPWNGYSDQKNFANSLAKGEWVLSIDADEVVSSELRAEIEALLATSPAASAYSVPRKTIHLGRWVRHGGWYPNRLLRLFRKADGRWVGEEVHERWETSGSIGELQADLIHYSFRDLADQVARNNRYSTLGARVLQLEGRRFSMVQLLVKPFSKFMETYFIKRGFLDRYPGFIISVSAAYSVFLKWAKLWELQEGEKEG